MKIAICISGETRDWDDYPSLNLEYFINKLENDGHGVDVYAHTWKHCELPRSDRVKFKELLIEDQEHLVDWIKEDWINRIDVPESYCEILSYDGMNHDDFDFKLIDFENLSDDQINEICEFSRRSYGQHVSGWRSFQLSNSGYDVYLRWRWDLVFTLQHEDMNNNDYRYYLDMNYFHIINSMNNLNTLTDSTIDNLGVMFAGAIIYRLKTEPCVEDTHFIFSNHTKQQIDNTNIYDLLDVLFDYDKTLMKLGPHSIWTWLMTDALNVEGNCKFHECAQITYRPERFTD